MLMNKSQQTVEINAPISFGELVDKITILEIKKEKIYSSSALVNINKELDLLSNILSSIIFQSDDINHLIYDLKKVNIILWEVEEKIREKDKHGQFDSEFIELARLVYQTNDNRSLLKRELNLKINSEIIEEKSYSS